MPETFKCIRNDGYFKSTSFRWVQDTDPLEDAHGYPDFPCGESHLVYPGPRLSLRWESLADAIEDCEKIRALPPAGPADPRRGVRRGAARLRDIHTIGKDNDNGGSCLS